MGRGKAISHLDSKGRGPWSGSSEEESGGGGASSNMGHTLTHSKQQQAGGQGEQASPELGSRAARSLETHSDFRLLSFPQYSSQVFRESAKQETSWL